MSNLNKYIKGDFSDAEFEEISERLIVAKRDRDKRKDWQQKLNAKYGVDRTTEKKPFLKRRIGRSLLAIAATLLLFLSIFMLLPSKTETSSLQAVNQYIDQLDIMANQQILRKGMQDAEAIRMEANQAYAGKEYEKSILLLENLATSNTADQIDYFYLGLCYLQKEPSAPEKSIDSLLKSREMDESLSLDAEISWVLSLAYLKAGKTAAGVNELSKIVRKKEYKTEEAKVLLKALEKEEFESE